MTNIIIAVFASSGLWGVIGLVLQSRLAKKRGADDNLKKLKEANLALLHDRIFMGNETLKIRKHRGTKFTINELKNFEYIYNAYKSLGGNGTGDEVFKKIKDYVE